jgi:hypothetical protein
MHHFRIRGLPADRFASLLQLSDEELAARHARRLVADGPGYPCRISLTDASPGDEILLVNYEHHAVDSPFRSSFGIYIREGERTFDASDEVPQQLRSRMLSLRGYDTQGYLRGAELIDGMQVESAIDTLLSNTSVAYVHAHFAKHGCYAALIERH